MSLGIIKLPGESGWRATKAWEVRSLPNLRFFVPQQGRRSPPKLRELEDRISKTYWYGISRVWMRSRSRLMSAIALLTTPLTSRLKPHSQDLPLILTEGLIISKSRGTVGEGAGSKIVETNYTRSPLPCSLTFRTENTKPNSIGCRE